MGKSWTDKVAIVTGAGQGIGRGHRRETGRRGRDRRRHRHRRGDRQGDRRGRNGSAAVPSGSGPTSPRASRSTRWSPRCTEQFGRIDVLVNNAGWDKAGPFVDSDPADWDRVIAINLYGVLHTSKAVLPIMAAQGSGSVVNLAPTPAGSARPARPSTRRPRAASSRSPRRSPARWPATRSTQLRLPRPDRHRAVRLDRRRQPEAAGGADQGDPVPPARRSRPTSPTPSPSSPPTRPPTSPARPSASAAASR